MTSYYVDFQNNTNTTWTMGVYQTLPNSIGLDSVSWKQTTVPHDGISGVSWDISYNVAIANYTQAAGIGVYRASQTLPATLGTAWKIIYQDDVQQLVLDPNHQLPADEIIITNSSGYLANPGIGMSGQGSVYKSEVPSGASAQFKVTPVYWVSLFNSLVLGEVISDDVIVDPIQLQFVAPNNKATVLAAMNGANIEMIITYSQYSTTSQLQLDQALRVRQLRELVLAK